MKARERGLVRHSGEAAFVSARAGPVCVCAAKRRLKRVEGKSGHRGSATKQERTSI